MSTMSSEEGPATEGVRRMNREERREQILAAAIVAFAEGGYAGTTTDQVARVAGVSQPYVVRLFGTKADLFFEVFDHVAGQILERFERVAPGPDAKERMADAYTDLIGDPNRLRVLMHGFVVGAEPAAVGTRAREVLGRVFELYRSRTGGDAEAARTFVATGMLLNVLSALEAPRYVGEDENLAALVECSIGRFELGAR
jgi:AcrR family transcriptional regulator